MTAAQPVYAGSATDAYLVWLRETVADKLTGAQHSVLTTLATYADWITGECYPAVTTIANKLGLNRGHVHRLLQQLTAEGLIERAGAVGLVTVWKLVGYTLFVSPKSSTEYVPVLGADAVAALLPAVVAPARHNHEPINNHQQRDVADAERQAQAQPPACAPAAGDEVEADKLLHEIGVDPNDRADVLREKPTAEKLREVLKIKKSWTGRAIENVGGWCVAALRGRFDSRRPQDARTATVPPWMTAYRAVPADACRRALEALLSHRSTSARDRQHVQEVLDGKAQPIYSVATWVIDSANSLYADLGKI